MTLRASSAVENEATTSPITASMSVGSMQLEPAGFGKGEHPEILEETLHQVDLVDDIGQALRLMEPVEHRLDLAADDSERGAELVTEIGEQADVFARPPPRDEQPSG